MTTTTDLRAQCKTLRGKTFRIRPQRPWEKDSETFVVEDAAVDRGQIVVWFQNDGTKWLFASEIELTKAAA